MISRLNCKPSQKFDAFKAAFKSREYEAVDLPFLCVDDLTLL